MSTRIQNLKNYRSYPETTKCYLDGRYFNLVLNDVIPDRIHHPMVVRIRSEEKEVLADIEMPNTDLTPGVNVVRVIIESKFMRHSSLLLIDTESKKCVLWDALTEGNMKDESVKFIHDLVEDAVEAYLQTYFGEDLDFEAKKMTVQEVVPIQCKKAGYCNAYVLKRAFDWLRGREFDPEEILRFVSAVEDNYSDKLVGSPDVEYLFGFGLGLLGGVALGAALAPRPVYYPAYGGYPYPYYY